MKIIVLDAHALNPGDLSWVALGALGEIAMHPRTRAAETIARAQGAEILITNKVALGRAEIESLPALRYIGVTATGFNVVDIAAARERGVIVSNVPAYGTRSVAQHVFALLLELTQNAGLHSCGTAAGKWSAAVDWCYWERPLVELDGLTMGIIGLGRIGEATARIALAFGMNVIATPPRTRALPAGIAAATVDEIFSTADVVSLHCPLTPETSGLVNATRLASMKPGAFLINTARGPLVDESALAAALSAGRIAGAGLDVLSAEPPRADNPLLTAPNCIITPHQAWATRAARARLMDVTVANVRAFLAGQPQNVVS